MRILLIEDDELIVQQLAQNLTEQNYTVDVVVDGKSGLEQATAFPYDLILLDVILPILDGISVCRQLRSQGIKTPILLLTAQDNSTNKVRGLDAGADDYLTKPFDLQELSARIRALLRRGNPAVLPVLEWGDLQLDPSTCEVTYQNRLIPVTPKEYSLLELFLRNPQRVYTRSAILDHIWSFGEFPEEETITSHIKGLRRKLKRAGLKSDPIETVYGIGYRLSSKPQKTDKQLKTAKQHQSAETRKQAIDATWKIWQRAKTELSDRVAAIEQAAIAIWEDTLEEELRRAATVAAHKLAGSLGMFDLDQGSRLAKQIEQTLQNPKALNQQQKLDLSQSIAAIRQELEQATQSSGSSAADVPEASGRRTGCSQLAQTQPTGQAEQQPVLLIVEADRSVALDLAKLALSQGLKSEIVPNSTAAREWISSQRPEIVLLDLAEANATDNELNLLKELSACTPPVPVLILSNQASLLDRVQLARFGGRGFLQKPLSPTQILEAIAGLQQRIRRQSAKVMVVDDDPLIFKSIHHLLSPWGIGVFTLEEPLKFWTTLEQVAPDLLILDVEMPHVNGIELCQVVRNDLRWSELPILFLTVHNDAKTRQQVFEAGADDYVNKPIVPAELVTRILNRLERSHARRSLVETDLLTGVAHRHQSTVELTQLLHLAARCQQTLCFALLDLESLKQVNEQLGYGAGDRLLARLGELLRQHFQSEDVVARWGGAKFAVGMYGMSCSEGKQRLLALRDDLNRDSPQYSKSRDRSISVRLSAGVVEYPQHGSNWQELAETANVLLFQTKAKGGNLILSADE